MLSFAYYAEHQLGLRPCILCLYQRPPHYVAAIAGVVLSLLWIGAPKWVSAVVYIALGLVGAALAPDLIATLEELLPIEVVGTAT